MSERTTWIIKTEAFLRETFDNSLWLKEFPPDKNYRLEHSFRVANAARLIAEGEGMDVEGLVIAGLLHEISNGKNGGTTAGIPRRLQDLFWRVWAWKHRVFRRSVTELPYMWTGRRIFPGKPRLLPGV